MESKAHIVENWLPRYTGTPLEGFGKHILLTNFDNYVEKFADRMGVEVRGRDKAMRNATAEDITMINFGMGSANAATIMDLLSAVSPRACLFLGKCGGLKKKTVAKTFSESLAALMEKLREAGDHQTADILEIIYTDEKGHVGIGAKWFRFFCARDGHDPVRRFQDLVRANFRGEVKPPFNVLARAEAGLTPLFYQSLASTSR